MISFITANFVGRALRYGNNRDWSANEQATLAAASPDDFMSIAAEVANAGFEAIDLWTAHCHWARQKHEDDLEQVKGICSQFDLSISSYAGGLDPTAIEPALKFMKQLGAPLYAGGLPGPSPAELMPRINDLCQKYGLRYAYENHAEQSAEEMLAKIVHGQYSSCGIAFDTGWASTQGFDAAEAIKRIREHLFIVHLKDVKAQGQHETCALGDGIVPIEKVVRYLVESDWQGSICIEHEPFDRDPMPEVETSLTRLKQWLK